MPGNTGAPHELPYAEQGDAPPSAEEALKPLAEKVHQRLDDIAPSQITSAGKGDEGKLLIVQNTGDAVFKALSGDVTVDAAGVTAIGATKVLTAMLADKSVTTVKVNTEAITLEKLTQSIQQALIPIGTLLSTTLETAPSGFLLMVGSNISRTTYADLFAKWGTRYGAGDESTTFGTPDLRGRALVGLGTHADVNSLTDTDGLSVGSRTPKTSGTFAGTTTNPINGALNTDAGTPLGINSNEHQHNFSGTTSAHGPAYAVANWMVKF